jgi:hypothetical protein
MPTNKWFVTQITATAALATAYVNVGHWSHALTYTAIGLVSQALVGYITPNSAPTKPPA